MQLISARIDMRRKSFNDMACGIARSLEVLGDGWTFLIMREAMFGTQSFDAFCDNLGIARNTLTSKLNELVDAGLLSRADDPMDKRRKIYQLEECGRELWVVLLALQQWGNKWVCAENGAPSFMADRISGKPVASLKVFDKSGRNLEFEDIQMIPGPSATEQLKDKFAKLK